MSQTFANLRCAAGPLSTAGFRANLDPYIMALGQAEPLVAPAGLPPPWSGIPDQCLRRRATRDSLQALALLRTDGERPYDRRSTDDTEELLSPHESPLMQRSKPYYTDVTGRLRCALQQFKCRQCR